MPVRPPSISGNQRIVDSPRRRGNRGVARGGMVVALRATTPPVILRNHETMRAHQLRGQDRNTSRGSKSRAVFPLRNLHALRDFAVRRSAGDPQRVENAVHVGVERGLEGHRLAALGVREGEPRGVQHEARHVEGCPPAPGVRPVAKQRCPRLSRCTRIWCVRPVRGRQRTSVATPNRSTTSTAVCAGRPPSKRTAIRVGW